MSKLFTPLCFCFSLKALIKCLLRSWRRCFIGRTTYKRILAAVSQQIVCWQNLVRVNWNLKKNNKTVFESHVECLFIKETKLDSRSLSLASNNSSLKSLQRLIKSRVVDTISTCNLCFSISREWRNPYLASSREFPQTARWWRDYGYLWWLLFLSRRGDFLSSAL